MHLELMAPKTGVEACGDDCTCSDGGYCERHTARKSAHAVRLCQTRPGYFRKYEQGMGLGQPHRIPSLPIAPKQATRRAARGGPGTELKEIIATWQRRFPWFDLSQRCGCGCADTARMMDHWGPDKCEEKMEIITNRLKKEAEERKLSVPFGRIIARRLVKQAIRRARENKG